MAACPVFGLYLWTHGRWFYPISAVYMNYPLYYLIGAGILCIGTGYLYERDRNIWGSSIINFVIGFMPRALGLK